MAGAVLVRVSAAAASPHEEEERPADNQTHITVDNITLPPFRQLPLWPAAQ